MDRMALPIMADWEEQLYHNKEINMGLSPLPKTNAEVFIDVGDYLTSVPDDELSPTDRETKHAIIRTRNEAKNVSNNDDLTPAEIDAKNDIKKKRGNEVRPNYYKDVNGSHDLIWHEMRMFSKRDLEGAWIMNVFKYVYRYRNKNLSQDLKKARTYIDRLIDLEENYEQFN